MTKEEIKQEKIKAIKAALQNRAIDRREKWVNMVADDPDFIQGILYILVFNVFWII